MMNRIKSYLEKRKETLKEDLIAGLIVAIVAFPLAIGFSIASNVDPAMGVVTAIIAGFFAAVFGGSEFQVSGPTGAMVVVILGVVAVHGVDGLIIATFLAGIILLAIAALKLGKIIEYIPSPVIVGFTAGIATIIFFGQLNNFLGISPQYPHEAEFIEKTFISFTHVAQANLPSVLIALVTLFIMIVMPKVNRKIPGSIVAVIATIALTLFLGNVGIKTVGDIGSIPSSLPLPHVPDVSFALVLALLPAALTIAILAAIESLLSAVVADSLTDTKHKPNQELFGQGIANIASSLFGGMPATGAIARTATNIRNGAKSRFSSIFHAMFVLLFVLLLGGFASLIPLPAIAGILMFVAYNMVEWERIHLIFKTPLSDIAVMATTFFLTILVDLTVAIEVGVVLASLLFMKRMSDLYHVEHLEGNPDTNGNHKLVAGFDHKDISIYTVHGPLFFGAASRFDQVVEETPGGHKRIKIIRMKHVPVIDATGINFIEGTVHKHKKMGGAVLLSGVHPDVMKIFQKTGIDQKIGSDHIFPTTRSAIMHALKHAHALNNELEEVTEEDLLKYNLSILDMQDSLAATPTKDVDPIENLIAATSIHKVHRIGHEHVKKVRKRLKKEADEISKGAEEYSWKRPKK